MRRIFLLLCLALPLPALAGAPDGLGTPDGAGAEAKKSSDGEAEKSKEEKIAELEAKRETLLEERDAARMRANVYVLPQDKLEVEAKTKEIQEVDRELEALRKDG